MCLVVLLCYFRSIYLEVSTDTLTDTISLYVRSRINRAEFWRDVIKLTNAHLFLETNIGLQKWKSQPWQQMLWTGLYRLIGKYLIHTHILMDTIYQIMVNLCMNNWFKDRFRPGAGLVPTEFVIPSCNNSFILVIGTSNPSLSYSS